MKLFTLIFLSALVLAGHPACRAADPQPIKVADLPAKFKGTYVWITTPDENPPYVHDFVSLTIDLAEEKDGLIEFTGSDFYSQGALKMKVRGTIDPKTRQLTMWESEPSHKEGSVTDGLFEGKLSPDLLTIDAIWTTRGTGKQGKLHLKSSKPEKVQQPVQPPARPPALQPLRPPAPPINRPPVQQKFPTEET